MPTIAPALLLLSSALAQEEVCPGPLTRAEWREGLDAVDQALADFNGTRALGLLDDLVHELRCLDAPADPSDLGRLARQRSLLAFYDQDTAEAESWAILSGLTLGGAPWPQSLPVPPAYHQFVADLPEPRTTHLEAQGVAPPKRGAVLLDGRLLAEPDATLGTMHLLQVADKKGAVLSTRWQHGAAFPPEVLGPVAEIAPPRWYLAPPEPLPMPEVLPPSDAVADANPDAPAATDEADPEQASNADEAATSRPASGVRTAARRPAVSADLKQKMFESKDPQEGCPWRKEPKTAEVKGSEVRINKHTYPVKTERDQAAFRAVLRSCGEHRAARRFTRWRDARRKLSLDAPRYKKAMIRALLTEEKAHPKRAADK